MTTAVGYSAEVVRRCQQMDRAGGWPEDDANVGTGVVGSLASGAMTRLQVRVDAAGARVDDTRFKVFGCSAAIACASLAADRVVGGSLDAARALDAEALADALELPDDKRAMAGQAVAAVTAAIEDWQRKSGDRGPGTRDQGRTR
jgi:NifU-like protein involved in Fe-S cluster formation